MDILLPGRFYTEEFEREARACGWDGRMIPVFWREPTRGERIRNRVLVRRSPSSSMIAPGARELAGIGILLHAWPMDGAELSSLVDGAPGLRWIHTAYTGAETVVQAVGHRSIAVTNAGSQTSTAVSEHALALLLAVARRLPEHFVATRNREWVTPPAQALEGSTLMVFGLGRIGGAAASKAARLGCRVIGVRDRVERGGPDEIAAVVHASEALTRLGEADYVLMVLPSTPKTENLVDREFLAAMRPGAALINVGRPESIVEEALVDALAREHLRAACLDVTREQPLSRGSPLYDAPNLWLTHHTAYQRAAGDDHLREARRAFLDNLKRYVRGDSLKNRIDLERGY
jgi:phosphoglycerate dehydrogenase-like enzyme